jgi:epoxyqueuosine reductase
VTRNDPTSLKESIFAEAKRLGFKLVGVTQPDPPPHLDVYERWLQEGHHGEMGYLSTDRARVRRSDPRLILPDCKSILVLGWEHSLPKSTKDEQDNEKRDLKGRIASYAWDEDYHDVLTQRLDELAAFIETEVGEPVANRRYTDTGPILERDLAQRAGLGWIGKNTCLINPANGSYILLAELFLDIELEADQSFTADRCGSCTRCLEACPTGCILPDRTLNATRCISYLTIELKGPIPIELRPQMDDWIFGCDVCQQVCPWNQRFARPEEGEYTSGNAPNIRPDLIAELSLTPELFNQKFKGSPVKRAKRRGYLRNVAVALGNLGQTSAIPSLVKTLQDEPEPLVRRHAAWALGQMDDENARRALQGAAAKEVDAEVLAEIFAALGE